MSLTQASDTENMQVKINLSDKQSKNETSSMAKTKGSKKGKGRSAPLPGCTATSLVMQNRKRQQKPRIKRVSWRDEQIEGMSVSDMPEFKDPAILVVRESIKIRYTRDELMKLRDVPLSKKKPDFFDASEVSVSILDPERWSFERKKSDTPTENGPRSAGDVPDHRRRPGDPRERIRKENDGIVLSPQRRSFNSGCFVPVRDTARPNRPHSPLGGKNEPSHIGKSGGVREIQSGTRRIGSGRILRDSWDFNEKPDSSDGDYGFRGGQQQRNSADDKYERRSFGRDFDREGGGKEGRRNGRYERRRIAENREQEEPEWFSGGPVSQMDTIELRGFDESEKPTSKKKLSPSRVKRAKEWSKKKNETQAAPTDSKEEAKGPAGRSTPTPQAGAGADQAQDKEKPDETTCQPPNQPQGATSEADSKAGSVVNDHSFNFDDILKCDTIPGLLTNGVGGDGDNMKSRFSRWFKPESPEKAESRRSSMQDDHHIIKDLLNDIGNETSVSIPGDSEAYFAPISPAGKGAGGVIGGKRGAQSQSQPINIMEMLQKGKQAAVEGATPKPPQMAGKILSLDELEAKMRQNADVSAIPQKHQKQKPDEEMTAAFKKLLAQAQAGGHPVTSNGPMNKTQPMSLLEMLNHSQQQDEAARMSGGNPHLLGAANPTLAGLHHHHHSNDLTLKLQQATFQQQQKQQMEMLNKLINATVHPQQMRTSPLHDMGMQQSRDLLNRPEAQAILQGLKRGEITTQHLYQQLANPALQPRHREMLVTILKIQGGGAAAAAGGYGPSPRVLSPVPPHHMFQQQQQQQQLRVSPLPPNAMHQRIPSPRELQVHTQNILQRALIKKKLEEQQENYRKKQEMQRGQSPNTNVGGVVQGAAKSVSSPTPLAFTPTSVLRKMTADKDEGKENKAAGDGKVPPGRAVTGMRPQPPQPQGQQWNPQFGSIKQPAGRPIVKANNNYQTQTPEQFFGQQQQRMFGQPPPNAAQQQSQQQQRKPPSAQFGQAPNGPGGPQTPYNPQYPTNQQFAQQLTQQQLRAQHQHRPVNQQMQSQQQQGYQQQQHQGGGQQMGAAWQQFFNSAQQANRSANPIGRGGANDGDLSPTTTNQLARWFSPDLLERARGGELPSTAGLAQHALSLEEIERQTAPPVHN